MIEGGAGRRRVDDAAGRLARPAGRRIATALFAGLLLLWSAMFSPLPARAQSSDPFVVANVEVDVTAANAAEARKRALAEGEVRAFNLLLKRLTLRTDHARLPALKPKEIADYLQHMAVTGAKTSPVRWLASLTFTFKPADTRRFLRESGFEFAETGSKPVLVLPVYKAAGVVVLWDEPNPWRSAWTSVSASDGLVPMRLPRGDLTDIATIGAEQAAAGDKSRLRAIARRYQLGDVIVALATLKPSPVGGPTLEIAINRFGSGQGDQTIVTSMVAGAGETLQETTRRAALDVAVQIEDQWKRDNLIQFGQAAVLAVRLPLRGLGDWVKVRKRLERVAVISRADLVLLSRDEARVNLHYLGQTEQLSLALSQVDLLLTQDESGWKLSLEDGASGERENKKHDRKPGGAS